jgi:hypothetical protein
LQSTSFSGDEIPTNMGAAIKLVCDNHNIEAGRKPDVRPFSWPYVSAHWLTERLCSCVWCDPAHGQRSCMHWRRIHRNRFWFARYNWRDEHHACLFRV